MKQILIKITSGEPILTQPHLKFKFLKKFYLLISENLKKSNRYFGIEENVSDQIWFYGFCFVQAENTESCSEKCRG
ncbi:hypothetical protein [Bacillus cereus]|uniref:hypothetical protein n=1 Tax=Bacillus cereus TaxID=1396 RepID=UPI0034D6DF6C